MSTYIIFETAEGVLSAIQFDCIVSETHSVSATATEHPVEDGAPLSDHVRPQLTKVQIDGLITNTPLGGVSSELPFQVWHDGAERKVKVAAPLRAAQTDASFSVDVSSFRKGAEVKGGGMSRYNPPLAKIPPGQISTEPAQYGTKTVHWGGKTLQFPERVDRVQQMFDLLYELCTSGRVVSLVTDKRYYTEMVILSVNCPREPMDAMQFSISFTEVSFASTEQVEVTITQRKPAEKRAEVVKDAGAKGHRVENLNENEGLQSVADSTLQSRAEDAAGG